MLLGLEPRTLSTNVLCTHIVCHWGGCTSGIRSKSINMYHKVNSDDELQFFLHANQTICNLAKSQQNNKPIHCNYGIFSIMVSEA